MEQQDSQDEFIDVHQLRIGMFVYLDLGWMEHPFALNSFKLTAQNQIDTILSLGINRIRWSPDKSDLADDASASFTTDSPAKKAADEATTRKVGADGTLVRQNVINAIAVEADKVRQRRECIDLQRVSLEHCEKQFAHAVRTYRLVVEQIATQPDAARTQTEQVIGDMVDKLLGQEESAIRLLSENSGDKSSLHALNVTILSLLLGKAMGLDTATLNQIGVGALLHDIGKIKLPERLRWRDKQFNDAERHLYEEHVTHGVAIGQAMNLDRAVFDILSQHHEMADGSGFPCGLSLDQLNLPSRIVALVDQYDSLCNPANPAQSITPHEALSQIFAQMKKKFDTQVLALFIRMMGVYPPGSVVELTDGRYALVVTVNSTRPLKPSIIVFEPRVPRQEALIEDLQQTSTLGIRRSLKPIQLPRSAFDYLSPRQRMCYFFENIRNTPEESLSPA